MFLCKSSRKHMFHNNNANCNESWRNDFLNGTTCVLKVQQFAVICKWAGRGVGLSEI